MPVTTTKTAAYAAALAELDAAVELQRQTVAAEAAAMSEGF
jgi:hypothetical protein